MQVATASSTPTGMVMAISAMRTSTRMARLVLATLPYSGCIRRSSWDPDADLDGDGAVGFSDF